MNQKYEVNGIRLKDQEEYEAALRDAKLIANILDRIDLNSNEDIKTLYAGLQSGIYHFETAVGRAFDDDIYERFQKSNATMIRENSNENKHSKENKHKNENEHKERRIPNSKFRKWLVVLLSVIGLGSIILFSIYMIEIYRNEEKQKEMSSLKEEESLERIVYQSENASEDTVIPYSLEENEPILLEKYEKLYNKNKKLIGWIKIADTIIDYPVLQTTDNEYYLTHGYEQDYDRNGSIFLDCECSIYPRSKNLIIYGHHMKSGKMFGTLNKYQSEDYYLKHKEIIFDTIYEEGIYEVMYVFRSKVYSEEDVTFKYYQFINPNSEAEFDSAMTQMQEMSLYDTGVTAEYTDELLTLSTCDYAQEDGRFVVVAKKVQ